MPPDPDMVDMIERAFIEAQIDSRMADMAYDYLRLKAGNGYRITVQ